MTNRQVNFENKSKKQNAHSINYLELNNGVYVIPYSFISGAVNLSEKGIEVGNGSYITNPSSFLQMVFTGKDAINVCWDNSTYFTPNETNPNELDYNFFVGDYFYGKVISGQVNGGVEISSVEGNDDFLAMKSSQTISIQFEFEVPSAQSNWLNLVAYHQLFVNDLYKRKLYKIPQVGENKWFYISNATPIFQEQTGKYLGFEVEFQTILDKLQNTGRAVEQYIQNGAPGEPRAVPEIVDIWDKGQIVGADLKLNEQEMKLDPNKLVKFVQTELQGAGGYNGCMVYGRKLTETNGVITTSAWKMLLPSDFYQFNANPLNKTSVPSSTYAFLSDYKLSMSMTIDKLEVWKKVQDSLSTCQCAGKILLGNSNEYATQQSGGGALGTHKSNLAKLPYWDKGWYPMNHNDLSVRKDISMLGSPYCKDTMSFNKNDDFISLFIKNTFLCMNNPQLPVEINFSKPYHLSDLPIIGRLFSPMIGDRTLFANKTSITQQGIGMFLDYSYLDKIVGIYPQVKDSQVWSFLSTLGGEMVPKYLGATSYNGSMAWRLSDKLGDGKDTILIGQRKYANGEWINTDHTPYLLNGDDKISTQTVDYGFVIDRVVVFSEFSGNVRVSFYGNNMKPLYATTIISTTKFLDNSYNNYMTIADFGTWPEQYISPEYNPTWPEKYGNIYYINATMTQFTKYNSTSVNPSTSQDITPLQGSWEFLYKRKDGNRYYGCAFIKNGGGAKVEIPYANLNLEGVVDRTTLKEKYKEINVSFEGTEISAKLWDRNWEQKPQRRLGSNEVVWKVDLSGEETEYNGDIVLLTVNGGSKGINVDWDSNFIRLNARSWTDYQPPFLYTNSFFILRFGQHILTTIYLLEEKMVVSIIDKSSISQQLDSDFLIREESETKFEYGWCPAWYLNDKRHIENFNSKIVVKYLEFIKK